MHVAFNSKERTMQEMIEIALSGGWRITEVVRKPEGSLFCTIVAVPIPVPPPKTHSRVVGHSRELGKGKNGERGG